MNTIPYPWHVVTLEFFAGSHVWGCRTEYQARTLAADLVSLHGLTITAIQPNPKA